MAPRPAKRQRRSTLITSDDDANENKANRVPLRSSTRVNAALKSQNSPAKSNAKTSKASKAVSTPPTSPDKSKKKQDTPKSKSLHSFFSKASEEERWERKADTPRHEGGGEDPADAIEDDDYSGEPFGVPRSDNGSFHVGQGGNTVKPLQIKDEPVALDGVSSQVSRFVKPPLPRKDAPDSEKVERGVDNKSLLPWSDRYGPGNLDEIAVHKRKVADVQKWLVDVLDSRNRQRLLVLKGPAGSGKTTTVALIGKAIGIDIVSWQNPTVSDSGLASSVAMQFDDFLNRGGLFGGLLFDSGGQHNASTTETRRLLLVEEFPVTMTRSSAALESFRSILLRYLSASAQSQPAQLGGQGVGVSTPPVVMIISETLLSSSTALTDSFTAHRLLGPELVGHPLVSMIDFNPVAHTFVSKALELVIKKEARDSKRRRIPGPAVIQKLAETGDIRSAVNTLEFLCVRASQDSAWSGTVAAKAKKGAKDGVSLTEMEEESLRLVSQRESTLDMFHAAGKVVYNKREDPRVLDTRAQPPPKPPDHLMYLYNPKVSQVDIEALLSETGTDIQTFISTLHENYILSCNGHDFADWFDGCADSLSIADIVCPESRNFGQRSSGSRMQQPYLQAGSSESLKQDEISFQIATRGLLFSLPHPVNRATPSTGRKADAFKMFYPASLRLWKSTEEIDSLLSLFVHQSSASDQPDLGTTSSSAGVASWTSRAIGFGPSPSEIETSDGSTENVESIANASKDDLVLEVLPYQTKIKSGRGQNTTTLSKITVLHGMTVRRDENVFDDDVDHDVDAPARKLLTSKDEELQDSSNTNVRRPTQDQQDQQEKLEKLYISDDDIQDD